MEYKFSQPKETVCFTCEHVFDGKEILLAFHDEDGDWQFLCGENNHETENGKVICLDEATKLDSTLNKIADLSLGYVAERKSKNDSWEISKW